MNPSKFDQVVTNRANQRVEEKVAKFKKTIGDAFCELHKSVAPNYRNGWSGEDRVKTVAAIMRDLLGKTGEDAGYPPILWEEEREDVTKELLATMDEMSKALAAPEITPSPQAFKTAITTKELAQ